MSGLPSYTALAGGLDQESSATSIPSSRAIACLNHECVPKGYQRTEGFERIDGRPAPHEASFWVGSFTNGGPQFAVGNSILGMTSAATGRIVGLTETSGDWIAHTKAGDIAIDNMTGVFLPDETIIVGGVGVGKIGAPPALADRNDSDQTRAWAYVASENRRAAIQKPPGAGPVRGVLWYDGALYSWRDNGANAGTFKSSPTGWQAVPLGHVLNFANGGPNDIADGASISGDASGATATVRKVILASNADWAEGDASGSLILDNITGVFQEDETISAGASFAVATIVGTVDAVTIPAGGRYEFATYNFYASTGFERAYGVNGVWTAFEFDGSSIISIPTGSIDDRPFLIAEHKDHLFLGFPKGSLQFSALGLPRDFTPLLGAGEIGYGVELTNLIANTADAMIVTTESSMSVLTGNDATDFVKSPLSKEAGAYRFSAQRVGQVLYMDEGGIRNATATQTYGNFRLGTYTALIKDTLEAKRKAGISVVASMRVKTKAQYLIFFSDGSGISIFMGRKNPEPMTFQYPFVVTCCHVADIDQVERIFVGTDSGWVYELNVGTSFDGAEIEAMVQLAYAHQGKPLYLKRYTKTIVELEAEQGTRLAIVTQFDGGSGYQPFDQAQDFSLTGSGGSWGIDNWGEFYWSSPTNARAEAYTPGQGESISPIIYSSSRDVSSYVLQGVWVYGMLRGLKR